MLLSKDWNLKYHNIKNTTTTGQIRRYEPCTQKLDIGEIDLTETAIIRLAIRDQKGNSTDRQSIQPIEQQIAENEDTTFKIRFLIIKATGNHKTRDTINACSQCQIDNNHQFCKCLLLCWLLHRTKRPGLLIIFMVYHILKLPETFSFTANIVIGQTKVP